MDVRFYSPSPQPAAAPDTPCLGPSPCLDPYYCNKVTRVLCRPRCFYLCCRLCCCRGALHERALRFGEPRTKLTGEARGQRHLPGVWGSGSAVSPAAERCRRDTHRLPCRHPKLKPRSSLGAGGWSGGGGEVGGVGEAFSITSSLSEKQRGRGC